MNPKVKKKVKILYIIDHLRGFAGTEKHLLQLVSNLNRKIFTCEIITFSPAPTNNDPKVIYRNYPKLLTKFKKQGIEIIVIPLTKIYGFDTIKKFFLLVRLIKRMNPDIVQTFHFVSDTFGVLAAKLAKVPKIVSSRRDTGDLKSRRQIAVNRIINPLIDEYIAVCSNVAERLKIIENIPLKKIKVIYNGLKIENSEKVLRTKNVIRKRLHIKENEFIVGVACNFRPEKGLETFFEAIVLLNDEIPSLRVIAVGDGVERNRLVRFCKENEIDKKIIFTGWVNNARVYIAAMDVACLTPNKNEGLSNVILEEMELKKPVIGTKVGGNPELIVDGETGILVSRNDSKGIAEAIRFLYYNKKIRRNMGENAYHRVKRYFSLDAMRRNYENYYLEIIE